ncbi:unnamed protein product [Symbiodinium sp. CCMP2456]|nr:unnamed protein product [Symbiodinium sp. CCMP2456]
MLREGGARDAEKHHGDFAKIELHLKRTSEKEKTAALGGGYVNESILKSIHGWDEQMISFSKARAEARGLLRKSAEHGADEWKAVLEEKFEMKKTDRTTTEATYDADLKARAGRYIYIYLSLSLSLYIYIYRSTSSIQ